MPALSRRRFLAHGAGALGTVLAGDLYATRIELHWLEVVRRALPVAGLPAGLAGKTLLQLSDLHIGRRVSDGYLARVFERAATLAPDLVVHTGDFVSWYPPTFGKMRRLFERAPRGLLATLGILGNHDYGRGWSHPEIADEVVATAGAFGVRMLRNEACEIAGKRRERSDGGRIAIGRDRDEVFRGPAIDPRGVRVEVFQHGRRDTRLGGRTTTVAFHRRLLYTAQQPPGAGMRMRGNLLNGITPLARCVTNDAAANPQATLTNGLTGTSDGSASVPGGA